jgi:hypothetical protein
MKGKGFFVTVWLLCLLTIVVDWNNSYAELVPDAVTDQIFYSGCYNESHCNIYSINTDGTSEQAVFAEDNYYRKFASISPSGMLMAYVKYTKNFLTSWLCISNIDGTNETDIP